MFARSVNSLNEEDLFDERGSSRQSTSPRDVPDEGYSENEESDNGQFVMNPDFSESGIAVAHQRRFTEPPPPREQRVHIPQRSNTAPSAMREYEKMVHPNAPMYQEGYVVMVRSSTGTMQKQQVPSHYDVPSALRRAPVADAASSFGTMQKQQVPSHYDVPSALRRAPVADAAASSSGTMQKQQVPSHYDVPSALRRAPVADAASSSSP